MSPTPTFQNRNVAVMRKALSSALCYLRLTFLLTCLLYLERALCNVQATVGLCQGELVTPVLSAACAEETLVGAV